eukprot:2692476-Amphidinium_carterae.3
MGDIEELSQQANIPRQLQQPPQPTKQEQDEQRNPELVFTMCQSKRTTDTPQEGSTQRSISATILDYAYIKSNDPTNKKWQVHTILTGAETRTGLCLALAIPTTRKGPTRYQLTQLKKFDIVMENGFGQTVIQELTIPWRHSSLHSHHGMGQWNGFTKHFLHDAERSGLTWWTGAICNRLTMFQNNYFLGCYNMLAS